MAKKCSSQGCTEKHQALGYCEKHYRRFRARGDADSRGLKFVDPDAPAASRLQYHGWTEVVRRQDLGPCWEWNKARHQDGYGKVYFQGRVQIAHRVAYEAWVGPIAPGLLVRHKCDNPPCVNPEHLETGTNADNVDDMIRRDRAKFGENRARGERHGRAKVSESDVLAIRHAYATGNVHQKDIARDYGLSQTTVGRIVTGERWAETGGPLKIKRNRTRKAA